MSKSNVASAVNLHITEQNKKTVTQIGMRRETGEIVFHNGSNAELRVDFAPAVLKDKDGKDVSCITVRGNGHVSVFDPDVRPGTKIKYTATIEGARPEDPIIIIED